MKTQTAKLYNWAIFKAQSTKAPYWIGLLFFLEIALFIPLDPILMFFCLQNKRKTYLYVAIAAIASTLSGLIGYFLGYFLWDMIGPYVVPHLISTHSFDRISDHFNMYESWAVFVGALLPFPLKALSLSAGVFHLNVWHFISCFLGARILRFLLIGSAMIIWGEKVKTFVDKHFHRIFLIVGAKVAAVFLLLWAFAR